MRVLRKSKLSSLLPLPPHTQRVKSQKHISKESKVKSKPFHLYLKKPELRAFINFIPIFCLASAPRQRSTAMRLLGYNKKSKFYTDGLTRTHLRDSYYILLFLVMTKDDGNTTETHRLINRIKFFNEHIEERVKLYFDIHDDKDVLSIGELEEIWNTPFPKE